MFSFWPRKHEHNYKPVLENARGVYSKRDEVGDEVHFLGTVCECKCGSKVFRPNDSRLREVEV